MPTLGPEITTATVVAVLKNQGDRVSVGDPMAEVTTDKVDVEIPSPFTGVVAAVHAHKGDEIPIGYPMFVVEVDQPRS